MWWPIDGVFVGRVGSARVSCAVRVRTSIVGVEWELRDIDDDDCDGPAIEGVNAHALNGETLEASILSFTRIEDPNQIDDPAITPVLVLPAPDDAP